MDVLHAKPFVFQALRRSSTVIVEDVTGEHVSAFCSETDCMGGAHPAGSAGDDGRTPVQSRGVDGAVGMVHKDPPGIRCEAVEAFDVVEAGSAEGCDV
jgi:hypothetical protein